MESDRWRKSRKALGVWRLNPTTLEKRVECGELDQNRVLEPWHVAIRVVQSLAVVGHRGFVCLPELPVTWPQRHHHPKRWGQIDRRSGSRQLLFRLRIGRGFRSYSRVAIQAEGWAVENIQERLGWKVLIDLALQHRSRKASWGEKTICVSRVSTGVASTTSKGHKTNPWGVGNDRQ